MAGNILEQSLVFLGAGVICVPIMKKLGMGSVLGYLLAGVIIGPYVFQFVGKEGEDIMHNAEFGVVMMLFLIGLELNPNALWQKRKQILGLGFSQVLITTILAGAVMDQVLGWGFKTSLALALTLGLSSTAMVLQTLKEKGLNNATAGKSSFYVLLFQDIAVIPILALLPLLTDQEQATIDGSAVPPWQSAGIVIAAFAGLYIAGRYFISPFMRFVSSTRMRELFVAASLLIVVGVAYLMQQIGLSAALGAFLAGMILANSPYRHELEADLEPFKGLLLGLFFIAVGATINFKLMQQEPITIISYTLGIMALKALVLGFIGRFFKFQGDQNVLFVLLLSQVGEFAFVLLAFAGKLELLDQYTQDIFMAVTTLSMAITPILLLVNEKLIDPYFGVKELPNKTQEKDDEIDQKHPIIIAGFGHFGSTVGRLLKANKMQLTILDHDSDRVDLLRKMGFEVYYGDATRIDLLKAAGADHAKLLIAAMDSPETVMALVKLAKKHFPHLKILARARNRFDAYELSDLGVEHIYRETLHSAVYLAEEAMKFCGLRAYTAKRKAAQFIKHDEAGIHKLAAYRKNMADYIQQVRLEIAHHEQLIQDDERFFSTERDTSWDNHDLKENAS